MKRERCQGKTQQGKRCRVRRGIIKNRSSVYCVHHYPKNKTQEPQLLIDQTEENYVSCIKRYLQITQSEKKLMLDEEDKLVRAVGQLEKVKRILYEKCNIDYYPEIFRLDPYPEELKVCPFLVLLNKEELDREYDEMHKHYSQYIKIYNKNKEYLDARINRLETDLIYLRGGRSLMSPIKYI